jgi:fructose-specific phosphotransferase system IIA component
MKLTDIVTPACVRVPLQATDKIGVITELVDLLKAAELIGDRDVVLRAILDREATRSTAVGHGLAVPHGKTAACPKLAMAIGRTVEPIDFEAKDGEPVNIIALLASPPEQTTPHIQALARITRLMLVEKFRKALNELKTGEEFYQFIETHEH